MAPRHGEEEVKSKEVDLNESSSADENDDEDKKEAAASGTTLKFNPPTGTAHLVKGGLKVPISTKLQCILCMDEYDNKSLEELREEDYAVNRKHSSSTGMEEGYEFGTTTQQPGLFGTPVAFSFHGTTQSKPICGTAGATNGFTEKKGTAVPFNTPIGSDSVVKGGVSVSVSTRHQCISCMNEYENESLEELRSEDYAANRKYSSSAGMKECYDFGTTTQHPYPFGTPAVFTFHGTTKSKRWFGTTDTFGSAGLFGQPAQTQNAGQFGQSNGFGAPTISAVPVLNSGGLRGTFSFGQDNPQMPLFGQTTGNTCPFGNNATTQSNVFGTSTGLSASNQPSVLSGQTTGSTGLFGNTPTTQSTEFGTSTGFGATNQPQTGLFEQRPTTPAFGTCSGFTTIYDDIFKTGKPLGFGSPTTSDLNFGATRSTFPFGQNNSQKPLIGQTVGKTCPFGNTTTTQSMECGIGTDFGARNLPPTGFFERGPTAHAFGTSPGFGTQHSNLFGSMFGQPAQTQNAGLLGKSVGFGAPTTSSASVLNFGVPRSTFPFDQNNPLKTGLFGQRPTAPAFGTSPELGIQYPPYDLLESGGLFGQPAQTQNIGLFGKSAGFGAPTTSDAPVLNSGGLRSTFPFGQNNPQKLSVGQTTGSTGSCGNITLRQYLEKLCGKERTGTDFVVTNQPTTGLYRQRPTASVFGTGKQYSANELQQIRFKEEICTLLCRAQQAIYANFSIKVDDDLDLMKYIKQIACLDNHDPAIVKVLENLLQDISMFLLFDPRHATKNFLKRLYSTVVDYLSVSINFYLVI